MAFASRWSGNNALPASPLSSLRNERTRASDRTVIVCHGLASNKSNHLLLARELVPHGYNVLIFDFRAHGESDGQLTSLGDLERRDVDFNEKAG